MENLKRNKIFLISTLSTDASFILNFAHQENIITMRDYNNLNHPNHTQESIVINLLDKVINKGDETCVRFEKLLQFEKIQENFPNLKEFSLFPTPLQETGDVKEDIEYRMTDNCGLCLIINNVDFKSPHSFRSGSDADEESLTKVFQWLGFTVCIYKNQTAAEMRNILGNLSQREHGDCFVCCILSHGSTHGVLGIDGETVSSADIFGPFRGTTCESLINKPKVFFIQACRGLLRQELVEVHADSDVGNQEKAHMDTVEKLFIPSDADFLVVRSTVKGYVSLRDRVKGSWFIQSLCEQLKQHCPKGEDINFILLCLNNEVCKKGIQMPVFKVTLKKKLVFRVKS